MAADTTVSTGIAGRVKDRLFVRALQTSPRLGDVDANLRALDEAVAQAADRDLVVTPELATHGYDFGQIPDALPLDLHDPRLQRIRSHGTAAIVGLAERTLHGQYNSAALLGSLEISAQHKITLPTYRGWEERKHFVPGGRIRTQRVGGADIATLICNDAWQPQLAWIAAQQGAEVLIVPTNSVLSQVGIPVAKSWDRQLRGIAVALQCYIVFVNRVGEEPCGKFWGGSTVYDPFGDVLAQAGDAEEELDAELDLGVLREARRLTPLLRESRSDVVLRETQRLLNREAEDF